MSPGVSVIPVEVSGLREVRIVGNRIRDVANKSVDPILVLGGKEGWIEVSNYGCSVDKVSIAVSSQYTFPEVYNWESMRLHTGNDGRYSMCCQNLCLGRLLHMMQWKLLLPMLIRILEGISAGCLQILQRPPLVFQDQLVLELHCRGGHEVCTQS